MLAWAIAIILLLPLAMVSAECLAALHNAPEPVDAPPVPPIALLIPAHDEEQGIAATIIAVRDQLRPCDRLVVIADNCSDATAAIAHAQGVEVIARDDPARRGKGFALAFGRDFLEARPPRIVIVLDADTVAAPGALGRLAARAAQESAAVQGLYTLAPPGAPGIIAMSAFAFRLKNFVRQRGLQRLAGCALLQGSGMAFPWDMFRTAPLATASLVEDLRLGVDLYLRGDRVVFEERARFSSPASNLAGTLSQRTRWEHGYLATAPGLSARLLASASSAPRAALLLALDIAVPPLGLLLSLAIAATVALGLAAYGGASALPFLILSGGLAVFGVCLALVWHRWGRDLVPAAALHRVPGYLVWKLPIQLRFLIRRERNWVRTERQVGE